MFWGLLLSGLSLFMLTCLHAMSTLLALELTMLSVYFLFSSFFFYTGSSSYIALLYLAVAVCEGALGLSVIVFYARASGNELFKSMSMTSW